MNTLKINGGTGLTSCLSVRLDQVCAYRRAAGVYPDRVDSSAQFEMYRHSADQDVSAMIIDPHVSYSDTYASDFNHGWQYAWYDEIDVEHLSRLAWGTCRPSGNVIAAAAYLHLDHDRCVILYRGNDKAKEIGRTDYVDMLHAALETGYTKFHVQTDEQDFLEHCIAHLPDVTWWDHLPRIQRNLEGYVLPGTSKQRPHFAQDFLAALVAIGRAPAIVCTTGNVSLWAMLYRGHVGGVWQAHGKYGTVRKLNA